ncbi:malonic semialdehyde reductase [Chitinimonas sp. BJB300]|uniref:malonic semialdehyde reductase n=1 Tax=Chitinimonas sp. BJB300 TaxID=1559339 RepID=UPI000C0FDC48|nr:malonic semialdehyde reductase [Chitinimonas sp. BJB300]PHV10225.1 malonic semialdehyde reductase [Chitinimonas sp. BJB300]TSJ89967.1 malonic semialdehyde reductase [Chitinimonas sp. BJB300]
MSTALTDASFDQLFRNARTHNHFSSRAVDDTTLNALYDLLKWAPTSANSSPARFVFVKSEQAKQKLSPAVAEANRAKTLAAPVTVIVAYDMAFYDKLPKLFPHTDARSWFTGNDALIQSTAFRNGTLQGGYLILAARALGLDCGPMSGFDNSMVDNTFFAGSSIKSNFLINLGYGDNQQLHPRGPRLAFEEACRIE